MPARAPEELHTLLTTMMTNGDRDGFAALYEPDATLIVPPEGRPVTGVTQSGRGTLVSRRRPDGTWRIAVDNPIRRTERLSGQARCSIAEQTSSPIDARSSSGTGPSAHRRATLSRVLDPWGPTDPLARALHLLRMDGAFYCWTQLTAPWGLTMPAMPGYLWFHAVISGTLHLEAPGARPRTVAAGELALVPHGEGHVLRSEPEADAPDVLDLPRELVSDRYEVLRHGGGGAASTLVCGAVRLEHPAARSLVRALPAWILVGAEAPGGEWIQSTLRLLGAEARRPRPGGEAVITRLADIIVIQAIRAWLDSDPGARTGWLGALRDPQIGRAIARIHAEPARDWTVAALAAEVAMSRSAFAARFSELVGEPAMQYVTGWRMQLALADLQAGDATVAQLADRLGYRSEAAFARAFKRVIGSSPGAVRRAAAPFAATAPPPRATSGRNDAAQEWF